MAEPSLALHKALFAALGGLSTPVYDGVPQGAALPYITLDTSISGSVNHLVERVDERFVFLTIWSEARGQEEVLRIAGDIDAALDGADLSLDTGSVVSVQVDRISTRRDADNATFSGQVTLRVVTQH